MKSAIVLDLDSTLVDTAGKLDDWHVAEAEMASNSSSDIFNVNADGFYMWGTRRPYCEDFLHACFDTADVVGVWSAGGKAYVDEIVEELFTTTVRKPDFVWCKEDCVMTLRGDKILRQKPLSKLWQAYPNIDRRRTLLIDDAVDVCDQHPLNHIVVEPWDGGTRTFNRKDKTLLILATWMKENLPHSKDFTEIPIRSYVDGKKV
jgi:hypothetical protein